MYLESVGGFQFAMGTGAYSRLFEDAFEALALSLGDEAGFEFELSTPQATKLVKDTAHTSAPNTRPLVSICFFTTFNLFADGRVLETSTLT